jgi:hypothetical protein
VTDAEPKAVKRRERTAATVVRLKLSGASFMEIADIMEYDTPGIARAVFEQAIANSGEPDIDYKMQRSIANAQLNALMKSVAPIALDNKHPEHLPYLRAAVTIVDRQIKLNGLDAPTRLEVSTPGAAEFEAVLEAATKALGGGPVEADIFEMEQAEDGVTWQLSDDEGDVHLPVEDDDD